MKIKLKLGVSEENRRLIVTPYEIGYTDEDWEELTDDEKQRLLTNFVDGMPEQPYWCLENFDEQNKP